PFLVNADQIIECVVLIIRFIAEVSAGVRFPDCNEPSKSIRLVAPLLVGFVGYGDYRKLRKVCVDVAAIRMRDLGHATQRVIGKAIPYRSSGVGRTMVGARLPPRPLIGIGLIL